MKAHQRAVRDRMAETDAHNLFGAWWTNLDIDISKAVVRPVDRQTCESIITKYEWLGCMPAVVLHTFGIFFDGACGGVVCYSPEYGENLGIWTQYGWDGKIILLSRGACVHWAHPHAGSKLIAGSIRQLPSRYEVVTATVDELAGEVGTLYQATNFQYLGKMRVDNPRSTGSWKEREGVKIGGRLYGGRALRHKFGTQDIAEIRRQCPSAISVKQKAKGRYVFFRGPRSIQRQHLAAIAHLLQPYPKRTPEVP